MILDEYCDCIWKNGWSDKVIQNHRCVLIRGQRPGASMLPTYFLPHQEDLEAAVQLFLPYTIDTEGLQCVCFMSGQAFVQKAPTLYFLLSTYYVLPW